MHYCQRGKLSPYHSCSMSGSSVLPRILFCCIGNISNTLTNDIGHHARKSMYVFYLLANAYVHLKLHMQWDLHLQIYVQTQRHLWCQPQRRMHGQNIADIGDCRTFRFAFCPHASYSRLGSRFFEGPQFPRKRLPTQTVASFISNSHTHILGSRFFEGPQFTKKGTQKAPGRLEPKSSRL